MKIELTKKEVETIEKSIKLIIKYHGREYKFRKYLNVIITENLEEIKDLIK